LAKESPRRGGVAKRIAQEHGDDYVPVQTEININSYPLWSMQSDRSSELEPRSYSKVYVDSDEGVFRREWTVIPSLELGDLGPVDQDVFTAVEELVARRGGMPEDGVLEFSFAEFRKILGWTKSGRTNQLVRESLERIAFTGIRTKNAFYSKDSESYVTDSFALWSVRFSDTSGTHGSISRHSLTFHQLFVNNWLSQYLKGLDTKLYWSLSGAIAKRLYRLIDQRRGKERVWSENIVELGELIPLRGSRHKSKVLERLKPGHKELVEAGFLEKVEREGERIRYVIGEEFARQQFSRDAFSDPGQAIALELLLGERVRGDVARELVLDHGSDYCIRYVKALPYQKIERSRSGWLIRAIKEGYELRDDQLPPAEESADDKDGRLFDADDVPSLSSQGENGSAEVGHDLIQIPEPDPQAAEIWYAILEEVSGELNAPSMSVWFEGTVPIGVSPESLTIVVPNSFAKDYIETRFLDLLKASLSRHLSPTASLEITVAGEAYIHNTNRTVE
jgi:hypothetical protein